MTMGKKYTIKLKDLSESLYNLIVGDDDSISIRMTTKLIDIGDNIVNLSALIICNIVLDTDEICKRNNHLCILIKEFLTENRGVHEGACIGIHRIAAKMIDDYPVIRDFIIGGDILSNWINTRNKIVSATSGKEVIKYRSQLNLILSQILDELEGLFKLSKIVNNRWEGSNSIYTIPLFPFLIAVKKTTNKITLLFAYDRYNTQNNSFNYISWASSRIHFIDKSHASDFRHLETLKRKILDSLRTNNDERSFMPLFAASYPSMQQLVDLLWEETECDTKRSMWLNHDIAISDSYYTDDELSQFIDNNEESIRNKILLNCIEQSPLAVLREVGRKEGIRELPGYVKKLCGPIDFKKRIIKLDRIWNNLCKEQNIIQDSERDAIKNQIYSMEVARLLGFPIHEVSTFTNIEYYINWVSKKYKLNLKNLPIEERSGILKQAFTFLELIYREMVIFYTYIYEKYYTDSFTHDDWEEIKTKIGSDTLGRLHDRFRKLNNLLAQNTSFTNKLIGANSICDYHKYSRIIKEGNRSGDLIGLRNRIFHPDNKGSGADCERSGVECKKVLKWILDALMFLGDGQYRVFPYKLTFTLMSHTHQGIRTCHYVTDLSDLSTPSQNINRSKSETKIYTDIEIDFSKVYYCLPNRRRSIESIWVNPLLISMNIVGF